MAEEYYNVRDASGRLIPKPAAATAPAPATPTKIPPSWFTRYKRGKAFPWLGSRTAQFSDFLMRKRLAEEAGGDPKGTRAPARSGGRLIPKHLGRAGRSLLTSTPGYILGGMAMPGNVEADFVRNPDNFWNSYMTLNIPEGEQMADVPGYGVTPEQMYQGAEVPDYDENFLNNLRQQQELQSAVRGRDEAELAAADPSDLSWRQSIWRGVGNFTDAVKEAISGESVSKPVEPPSVWNLAKKSKPSEDPPIAKGTTELLGVTMPTEVPSYFDKAMALLGDTGGGVDWKDAEKTHSMLLAGGILSGEGGGIANSFFNNVLGMARMQNDQRWRLSQLLMMNKETWYPYQMRDGLIVLDTANPKLRPIKSLHPLDNPGPGYTKERPTTLQSSIDAADAKEALRILETKGPTAAFAFKLNISDRNPMTGLHDLGAISQELGMYYKQLHPDWPGHGIPDPKAESDMKAALNGRTPQQAIDDGDLEPEQWEIWLQAFGNWIPE
jgi:hypothetical protein